MNTPTANTFRLRLRTRLCEAQAYRCAVCTNEIKPVAYADDIARASVVAIDRSKHFKNYANSVALCGMCAGLQANYPTLMAFYEAYCAGTAAPKVRTLIPNPETEQRIRAYLREHSPVDMEWFAIPTALTSAPPNRADEIAQRIIRVELSKAKHNNPVAAKTRDAMSRKRGQKRRWLEAQNHRCCYCGCGLTVDDPADPNYATWEHVEDIKYGGGNNHENLVLACQVCNSLRDHLKMTAFEFYEWVQENRETLKKRIAAIHRQRKRHNKPLNNLQKPKPLYDY